MNALSVANTSNDFVFERISIMRCCTVYKRERVLFWSQQELTNINGQNILSFFDLSEPIFSCIRISK